MKLSPSKESPYIGSHSFVRDMTIDADAPTHPGCHETGHFVGSWGSDPAKGGAFWIVLMPFSGSRAGCTNAGDNGPIYQGNTVSPDKALLSGDVKSAACTLTINTTTFTKGDGVVAVDGGSVPAP
jgi:hypothetical protein